MNFASRIGFAYEFEFASKATSQVDVCGVVGPEVLLRGGDAALVGRPADGHGQHGRVDGEPGVVAVGGRRRAGGLAAGAAVAVARGVAVAVPRLPPTPHCRARDPLRTVAIQIVLFLRDFRILLKVHFDRRGATSTLHFCTNPRLHLRINPIIFDCNAIPLPWRPAADGGRRRSGRRHDLGDVGKVDARRLLHRPVSAVARRRRSGGEAAGELGPRPAGEGGVPLQLAHLVGALEGLTFK